MATDGTVMRDQHVDLGTAAKGHRVCQHPDAFLGSAKRGAQIVVAYIFYIHPQWHFIKQRYQPFIGVASFSAAQIGGLLWYELTVYRGLSVVAVCQSH